MAHKHSHATGNLKAAFFLNLFFTVREIVGGLYANSFAILSDAGDCLSIGVSWRLQALFKRGPTENLTYGYQRYSPLGALITGSVLCIGVAIIYKAIPRLSAPQPVQASGMILLAIYDKSPEGYSLCLPVCYHHRNGVIS